MTVLNFKDFNFKIILNSNNSMECIMLCTPWGLTQLRDGIQCVTLVGPTAQLGDRDGHGQLPVTWLAGRPVWCTLNFPEGPS